MNNPSPAPNSLLRNIALISLPILGIVLVLIAIRMVRPRDVGIVTVVVSGEQAGADINTGEVIDATVPGAAFVPQLGYRYKVLVEDESDDRSSGIAKIGGRTTFISGARRGQIALADVTRVRDRVVDAVLVRVLDQVDLPPKAPRTSFVPAAGDSAGHVVVGAEMDVVIAETSSKNPTVDGIARIGGLVVVVNGVPTIGERVNVRVTGRLENIAFAEPTGNPAGTDPLPEIAAARPMRAPRAAFVPPAGDPVVAGAELDVVIAEESEKNPGLEGIAKVGGLVVAVKGATSVGERVNVRIVERMERIAFAEPTGKPAGTGPLPTIESSRPTRAPRAAFVPPAGDPVVAGAELDVVISEASEKNPGLEGIARIGGLVVAVKGATTVGERVNVRIVDRMDRIAFAEPTGKPAGTDPLPVATAPARYSGAPRPAFVPGPGDSAAHVVPGAVIAATITEASEKNPTTEGVTRINGLVVFVRGATTVGQSVNVRIVERRERIAIGEVTTDAPTAPAPAPVVALEAPVVVPAAPAAAPAAVDAPAAPAAPAAIEDPFADLATPTPAAPIAPAAAAAVPEIEEAVEPPTAPEIPAAPAAPVAP